MRHKLTPELALLAIGGFDDYEACTDIREWEKEYPLCVFYKGIRIGKIRWKSNSVDLPDEDIKNLSEFLIKELDFLEEDLNEAA